MNDISFYADQVRTAVWEAVGMITAPSVLYRPRLLRDGNQWCALLGDDLQSGLAGFGDTPNEAMRAFDHAFQTETTQKAPQT
jgi:hypothetical protein